MRDIKAASKFLRARMFVVSVHNNLPIKFMLLGKDINVLRVRSLFVGLRAHSTSFGYFALSRRCNFPHLRKYSEPSKHFCLFPEHKFNWKIIIMNAPTNTRARKNLEAASIALKRPSLNDQMDSNQLILFRYGVK